MKPLTSLITTSRTEPIKWDKLKESVLNFLKSKKATLREIEEALNLTPSYRKLLVLLLGIMEAEGVIRQDDLLIPMQGGIIRLKCFTLKNQDSSK